MANVIDGLGSYNDLYDSKENHTGASSDVGMIGCGRPALPWIEANAGFADKILGKQPEVVEWDVLECAEVTEIKFGAWSLSTNGVTACSGAFHVAHYEKSSPAILKVHMDRVRATNGTVELYWDNGTRILPED